jgi:protein CWC15
VRPRYAILKKTYFFFRWDEDVVFKNQSRGEEKEKKRFINDTVRNDFHRKFLRRYIK